MRRLHVAAAAILAALAVGSVLAGESPRTARIAVLLSYNGAPFAETLKGFDRSLSGKGIKVQSLRYQLDGNPEKAARATREIMREKPHLIFALGSLAAEAVQRETQGVPLVAGMVLRRETIRTGTDATGVFLEFGPQTQFEWLRRILPKAKTVGVLYNPGENRERIEEAIEAASRVGLILEARAVNSPQDLPTALDSLARRADVLWGMYDSMVTAPETARQILLFSFRYRIPVIGPSAAWVRAGALYSLEWDYEDVGVQCGEKALRVLEAGTAKSVPMEGARKIRYALNLHTANQMQIEIPESLVRSADPLFRAGP